MTDLAGSAILTAPESTGECIGQDILKRHTKAGETKAAKPAARQPPEDSCPPRVKASVRTA